MKKQDFKDVMRGDPREEIIYISGDYSAHKISFGVKAGSLSNMLNLATADILIQKLNSAAGGDDDQITAAYANGKTKITVKLEKDDTQDFTEEIYSYDITAQPTDNSTEPETVAIGELAMIGDVQNDFSGTDLPADATRYIPMIVSDFTDGYFIKRSGNTFVGYDLASVISASHSHANSSVLAATQESFTTALKGNYDAAHSHVSNTSNPHSVTASQVGLGNVTNESKATMFTNPTFTGATSVAKIGIGAQPVSAEEVGLWANVSGAGGGSGVLRAGQFYATYSGTNAFTGIDIVADGQTATSYDHLVGAQIVVKNSGGGTATKIYGQKIDVINSSGTLTNSYGIYLNTSGAGTTTNKWGFYQASGEKNVLYGNLSIGTNSGNYALTLNSSEHTLIEFQRIGANVAYMGTGHTLFSGGVAGDFGVNIASSSRSIFFGGAGVKFLTLTSSLTTIPASLAIGGATIGANALAVTGTADISGSVKGAAFNLSALQTPPASAGATGTAGQIVFGTDGYLYLCTAANTWVRAQLTTWS